MNIPDPYYRALALIKLTSKIKDKNEIIDEIKKAIEAVESEYLKKRLERMLNTLLDQ